MLCYRCGSHVTDGSATCPNCGQSFASGGLRQATGTFSRRKLSTSQIDGAPYKPGDVISGRYTVKDIVGQGPVGFVFRAHDKEMDVEVALKSVSPRLLQTTEERRAFAREFKGARKLNHNNIARIYEEGEHDERPYYTSQYLDGLSLRKIIDLRKEKGQFFRIDEIEPILAQIAGALDAAHHAGVVHGDLKPENVLVLPDLLKVSDFALGMAMPRLPFVNAQRARKADRYCAPEFAVGGEVSSAIDVYALGVILGEMLAGVLPEGGDIPELSRSNSAVTPALESMYRRAINGNPASRFARAGALAAEIALIAGSSAPEDDVGRATVPMSRKAVADALAASQAQAGPPARPPTDPARRTSVTRRPPPPPVLSGSDEVEVTPVRPPPAPVTDALHLPPVLPPLDPQEALPTKQISLPDGRGDGANERTQILPAPTTPVMPVARPMAVMPLARPLPARPRRSWTFPALVAFASLAGAGGGWLYINRTNQEMLQAQARAEAQQRADLADAGRWQAILAAQVPPVDAGPDMRLTELPIDAGAAAKPPPSSTTGTELAMVHTTGGDATPPVHATSAPCPAGMAYISAGTFMKGYRSGDPLAGWDEVSFSRTRTDGYCIDLYEFPDKAGQTPTTNVTYADAEAACTSQGKRLCSENEWERACKGPSNERFAWGEKFDRAACNLSKGADPSGNHAKCKSGYGVFDLSGNVAEWTSSRYSSAAGGKAVKGAPGEALARCAGRKPRSEGSKEASLGFRCCKAAE